MKISAKARWSLYATAAVLTVAAMWLVNPRDADIVMPASASSPSRHSAQSAKAARSAQTADEAPAPPANDAIARLNRQIKAAIGHAGVDPFRDGPTAEELQAAAAAQAAAVAAQAVAAAQQQRAEVAAPPPPPPPPPFRYLGRWKEQGRTLAFLQSGDRVVAIDGPGPLDGSPWKVVALGDDLVTLQMAKGPKHTLSFEAPGNATPAPAAVAVAAATPASAPAPAAAQATPATPARAAPSATPAQETPTSSNGTEHAPGWEEN
ncbi:hypothetical protein QTH90_27470 [Variovorax sp. J2P1-59]|uniref:hypothetical protein n=1 Tax=Variovorax flavidus TaxID=3053501 RepID=UPI0025752BF8|nr:hypothetical protein [Variovorax sp. J2P1-59]MDM0078178.1 hypothetical protein [Variovorax sp. J2P1-59]